MSADNWAVCPRCRAKAEAEHLELQAQADAGYGTLPVDEFFALRDKANAPLDLKETFREDYEIYGADEGTVKVSYSGHCSVCGLGLDFQDERKLDV